MDYLCLIYLDEARLAALPRSELESLVSAIGVWEGRLRQHRQCLALHRLGPSRLATTVRARPPRLHDGPCAGEREQLSVVALIRAPDLDQALQLAAALPLGALGGVEVRPLAMEQTRQACATAMTAPSRRG
ncbi:YciI family protein [Alloalcanivorax mobilis]|uniref:YciI family protein n=1 Tax=Alloalcanivorax mobilis TaxID=2019569 RepID=UPI000C779EB2|nr:YciI family protein [Alloalcanivorax mobilis]